MRETGILATEIQEYGYGGGGDSGRQQKRCGTTEMAFWGKSRWRRHIVARMSEVETQERQDVRMIETESAVDTWEDSKGQQQPSDIHIPIVGVDK